MTGCEDCTHSGDLAGYLVCFRYPPQLDNGRQGFPEAVHRCGEFASVVVAEARAIARRSEVSS